MKTIAVVLSVIGWAYAEMIGDPPPVLRTVGAAAPQPPVPLVEKRWVWLVSQRCWGYGYQRSDGLWVIDPGSKRYAGGSGSR